MKAFWPIDDDLKIVPFPREVLVELSLRDEDVCFLSTVGLPDSVAPFLGFECPVEGLPSVAELWGLSAEFERYRVIGSNGSGDPIAIDPTSGEVFFFNHDNRFERVFMASSVRKLAETLRCYGRSVDDVRRENGEEAFLDNDIPEPIQERFRREVAAIDPSGCLPGTFWAGEMEAMAAGPWE